MNSNVDAYFANLQNWGKELLALRGIILDCGLTEELKWSVPVYSQNKKNIVTIGGFKENCVLSFFKGALLSDSEAILSRVSEHTQAIRLIRFTNVRDIVRLQPTITAYIYEAIEIENAGLKVDFTDRVSLPTPPELTEKFKKLPTLKKAFNALTPGRQRAYLMYFNDAKQSKTRTSRIDNCTTRILKGLGIND